MKSNTLRAKKVGEKAIVRLKKIEGQIRGLEKMIAANTYCIDIITQTSAVKSALSSVENLLLEEHLAKCAFDQIKSGNNSKAIKEILKVYNLKS